MTMPGMGFSARLFNHHRMMLTTHNLLLWTTSMFLPAAKQDLLRSFLVFPALCWGHPRLTTSNKPRHLPSLLLPSARMHLVLRVGLVENSAIRQGTYCPRIPRFIS